MTNNYVPVEIGKPNDAELAKAIHCFSENKSFEPSAEEYQHATMVLIGEACSQLSGGATKEEVLVALGGKGLSRACAMPVVEKADEVVHSAVNTSTPTTSSTSMPKIVASVVTVIIVVLVVFGMLKGFGAD